MFSHDSRLRCDLVDLYHTLYGTKRPVCIPLAELTGIMNLNRFDPNRKKSPTRKELTPSNETKKQISPLSGIKDVPPQIIMESVECMNVEVVATDDKVVKVIFFS